MASQSPDDTSGERTFNDKGIELQRGFQDWWMEARKSEKPPTPLDFLVNLGVETSLARTLVGRILAGVVPHDNEDEVPVEPGAIDYFVQHTKDAFAGDTDWDNPFSDPEAEFLPKSIGGLLERGLGPDTPSEQDIMSLTKVTSMGLYDWKDAVQYSISRNFSMVFQLFLWTQCPRAYGINDVSLCFSWDPATDDQNCRPALARDCLKVIQHMLLQLERVEFKCPWTEEAFVYCLKTMLHTKTPNSWTLSIPNVFVDSTNNVGSSGNVNLLDSTDVFLPPIHPDYICSVEHFKINLSEENKTANSLVLDCLPHLIRLTNLELNNADDLDRVVPPLVRALNNVTTLERISIDSTSVPTGLPPLLDLLEALKTNSSLVTFAYSISGPESEQHHDLYGEKLVEVLQEHNTTLQNVVLNLGRTLTNKIIYFCELNKGGRGIARDPETKVGDFVALLCNLEQVPRLRRTFFNRGIDLINLWYGLLREQPGTWSLRAANSPENDRKRKRS